MWENSENISIVLNMYNPKESAINLAVGIQEVNWPHMYGKSYITYINISLQSWPKLPPLYCLSLLDGELVCRAKFLHWGGASLLPFFYVCRTFTLLSCAVCFYLNVCMTSIEFHSMCSVQTVRWACLPSWCSPKLVWCNHTLTLAHWQGSAVQVCLQL